MNKNIGVLKYVPELSKQDWFEEIDDTIEGSESDVIETVVPKNSDFFFKFKFAMAVEVLCFIHWQLKTTLKAKEACQYAVDAGLRYFGTEFSSTSNKRWAEHFSYLLLPAVMLKNKKSLATLGDWLDPNRKVDAIEPNLKELIPLMMLLANDFRTEPLDDLPDATKLAAKCKDKSNSQTYAAYVALKNKDTTACSEALCNATEIHAKSKRLLMKKQTVTPMQLVARFPSMILNLASQRGLKLKPLPAELSPFIIPPIF